MLFVMRFEDFSEKGPSRIDMSLWLHLYAFDCLGEVNVSRKFPFLECGKDV